MERENFHRLNICGYVVVYIARSEEISKYREIDFIPSHAQIENP
jgi:hypothetical protein